MQVEALLLETRSFPELQETNGMGQVGAKVEAVKRSFVIMWSVAPVSACVPMSGVRGVSVTTSGRGRG